MNAGRPCYNLTQNYFLSKRANSTSQTSSSGKRLGANFDSFLVSSIFKTILQNLVSHNRVSYGRKGNFRVVFCLCVRTKVRVRNLSCKNVFTQLVPFHSIQTHFHIKSFARELWKRGTRRLTKGLFKNRKLGEFRRWNLALKLVQKILSKRYFTWSLGSYWNHSCRSLSPVSIAWSG